jgi:hypothetical protein
MQAVDTFGGQLDSGAPESSFDVRRTADIVGAEQRQVAGKARRSALPWSAVP